MKEYLEDLGIKILIGLLILVLVVLCLYVIIGLSNEIYKFFSTTKEICLGGHYELRQVPSGKSFVMHKFFICDSAKIIY